MRVKSRRWKGRIVWLALACALTLSFAQLGWGAQPAVDQRPALIDWGTAPVEVMEPEGPPLRIGAYITNISNIDLLEDQFSVEMLLWTTWGGDPQADPSDDSERDL